MPYNFKLSKSYPRLKLKITKGDPPSGYSFVSWFKTHDEANYYYSSMRACGIKYPIILTRDNLPGMGIRYILWKQKTKNSKVCGVGYQDRVDREARVEREER